MTKCGQTFYEAEANALHPEGCRCSETNGAGDCDWCQVFYGGPQDCEWCDVHTTTTDKMTGQMIRYACLDSSNQLNFAPPYDG